MKFQKPLLLSCARRDDRARNDLRHLRSSAAAVAVERIVALCGHLRFPPLTGRYQKRLADGRHIPQIRRPRIAEDAMARSNAATVEQYLAELPAERREVVSKMRDLVRRNLPKGYAETMNWGMISYEIPLERYPNTYNRQPLSYVALAAQKNYYALYLTSAYQDSEQGKQLAEAFKRAGKKLDMGKSCLRFNTLDDLPLDVIARVVASTPPEKWIAQFEAARAKR
jgi:uncharacterized protein YdhG (YjbR/CyaY superfamily)